MAEVESTPTVIRFGIFEADLQAGELRKAGVKLKLSGQPFQVLTILLTSPGKLVTREELQKQLWPDTFVDVDHNLNTAINKIREVLADSADTPRYVETIPRRGYRFIGQVESKASPPPSDSDARAGRAGWRKSRLLVITAGVFLLAVILTLLLTKHRPQMDSTAQPPLTRLTFDTGVQREARWSPDGRFIAYSSDRGGKFDIYLQAISGGDPIQVTHSPGNNWQPDWSPDGRYIAYRSENGDGGLFVIPAVSGQGTERKIAGFGFHPRWSPDGSRILFRTRFTTDLEYNDRLYVVKLDGSPPREVLADFLSQHKLWEGSATWHPDGRITLYVDDIGPGPVFWTVPIEGGPAVKSEIDPSLDRELRSELFDDARAEWTGDFTFDWAPSGKAIYFERAYRGTVNLWKLTVDPQTLRGLAIERVTTGSGWDVEPAVSPDGRRLVFTTEPVAARLWLIPFDASSGRLTGDPRPLTSPGMGSFAPTLSRHGELAFVGSRHGNFELWKKQISNDAEAAPFITGDFERRYPQWSPDGKKLAYTRVTFSSGEEQLVTWSTENRTEEPLTSAAQNIARTICDWTPDGTGLLVSQLPADDRISLADQHKEIWWLPLLAAPHAESAARKVISDSIHDFWQARFSPNGRWIVFGARINSPTAPESALYVMPTGGGPWTRITDGSHWDHEPVWAPDGKTIYFLSRRDGYFNVWGIHFDAAKGEPVGSFFQVTSFEHPALMNTQWVNTVGPSVQQDKMVLTMQEISASIWLLDNISR